MMGEIVVDSRDVASLPWRPFAGGQGVCDRVLWQDPHGASYAGLLHMEPGTSVAPHRHRGAVHHLWVVSGECTIDARTLGGGSYVFVPQGLDHAISGYAGFDSQVTPVRDRVPDGSDQGAGVVGDGRPVGVATQPAPQQRGQHRLRDR